MFLRHDSSQSHRSTQCDEGRPKCTRCVNRQSACQYAPLGILERKDSDNQGVPDIGGILSMGRHISMSPTSH